MAMPSVLTFGQRGYPIQGLGSHGGAEGKKPSIMRFTSEYTGPSKPILIPLWLIPHAASHLSPIALSHAVPPPGARPPPPPWSVAAIVPRPVPTMCDARSSLRCGVTSDGPQIGARWRSPLSEPMHALPSAMHYLGQPTCQTRVPGHRQWPNHILPSVLDPPCRLARSIQ